MHENLEKDNKNLSCIYWINYNVNIVLIFLEFINIVSMFVLYIDWINYNVDILF